jgi:glucans biosynthesis protein
MRRRDFIGLVGGMAASGLPAWALMRSAATAQDDTVPFDAASVRTLARELAAEDYVAADRSLPAQLDKLSYDDYRNIRFDRDSALWHGTGARFEMQMFSRGFLFRDRVDIHVVRDGRSRRVAYDPAMFRFEHGVAAPDPGLDLGFSGFRLHGPMNSPDTFDEIAAFQGASYFRGIGRDQVYGTSARGLAIDTAAPSGEEFPQFKAFWVEEPRDGADTIVVHALLDSPSCSGAFRFTVRPGDSTDMAVEMTLYPRRDLEKAGLAPLTSMFLFGPNDRDGIDDYRPAAGDADGLAVATARDEILWRPLVNPRELQISVVSDAGPRGFGLMQRRRAFFDYQDLEARYERRPSVWVEPIGDWGPGAVHLVEIPTSEEIHDNIVAFWRPQQTLLRGGEYSYTYRLHWGWDRPGDQPPIIVGQTRIGGRQGARHVVLDLTGEGARPEALEGLTADVTASAGEVRNLVLYPNPEIDGLRLAFDLAVDSVAVSELRATVMRGDRRQSEVWLYRWTP